MMNWKEIYNSNNSIKTNGINTGNVVYMALILFIIGFAKVKNAFDVLSKNDSCLLFGSKYGLEYSSKNVLIVVEIFLLSVISWVNRFIKIKLILSTIGAINNKTIVIMPICKVSDVKLFL